MIPLAIAVLIGLFCGTAIGFLLCALLTHGATDDELAEAYRAGVHEGRIRGTADTAAKIGRRVAEWKS